MATLENAQEKIQKICNELREVTLEPAKKQAELMIEEAHLRQQEIVKEGELIAKNLIDEARQLIERERNVFQSSLTQGMKQGLEALKQEIQSLFNAHLLDLVKNDTKQPQVIAKLINSIVKAIEKEGILADLSALIPKEVPANEVNDLLLAEVLKKLKNNTVSFGSFGGGAQIKLESKGLTIDISDQAINELLLRYIPKDLRKRLFNEQ